MNNMLIGLTVVIIHNVYIYQNIMLYTLSTYNFYLSSVPSKAGKNKEERREENTQKKHDVRILGKDSICKPRTEVSKEVNPQEL